MINAIIYNRHGGHITQSIQATGSDPVAVETTEIGYIETSVFIQNASDSHYVREGLLIERPSQQTNMVGLLLQDLPIPCTIYVQGGVYPCVDPTCQLDFTYPGRYMVMVTSWPFKDVEFEVTV